MSGECHPPPAYRFRKGQSGNPKGRPRKQVTVPPSSAFDIIVDRTLSIVQGGRPRDVTLDEALQHKTYQEALAGNRAARREVLKMIGRRERALASRRVQQSRSVALFVEVGDPDNANAALLLLGIVAADPGRPDSDAHFLLEPWAVQAALSRPGSGDLSERDIEEIKRCTRDAASLRWPRKLRP